MVISSLAGSNGVEETPRPPGGAITGNVHGAEVKKILVTQMMQKQGPRNHFRIVLLLLSCRKWSVWKISTY